MIAPAQLRALNCTKTQVRLNTSHPVLNLPANLLPAANCTSHAAKYATRLTWRPSLQDHPPTISLRFSHYWTTPSSLESLGSSQFWQIKLDESSSHDDQSDHQPGPRIRDLNFDLNSINICVPSTINVLEGASFNPLHTHLQPMASHQSTGTGLIFPTHHCSHC